MANDKDFRYERFTWTEEDAKHIEFILPHDILRKENANNLKKMQSKELSNEKIVQLSERNMEIQKQLKQK